MFWMRSHLSEAEGEVVRAALLVDPAFNAYALADLHPRYAAACRWIVATGPDKTDADETDAVGLVLLYTGLEPPILMATGNELLIAQAIEGAAEQGALPPEMYMSVAESVYTLLTRYYTFDEARGGDVRPMWRMVLDPIAHAPDGQEPDAQALVGQGTDSRLLGAAGDGLRLVALGPEDVARVNSLYAHGGPFTPDAFDAYQLDGGSFFGIEATKELSPGDEAGQGVHKGALIAVGGTHVIDTIHAIAAVGNMYTHPQWRGKGLGTAVLDAIVADLRRQGISLIVLNVDRRNTGARHLYEKFGFRTHCAFVEGCGVLQSGS